MIADSGLDWLKPKVVVNDDVVEPEAFRAQARLYGLDESEHLAVLESVLLLSREQVGHVISFFKQLAQTISHSSAIEHQAGPPESRHITLQC